MQVKIVFNNEIINNKFSGGWGFSCLVGEYIIFDTGEKAEYLFNNMKLLDVKPEDIKTVVISHDHWDHTGGLWRLLDENKGIKVYGCPGFSQEFKKKVRDSGAQLQQAQEITEIAQDVYTTGEIKGSYKGSPVAEQALVVKAKNGITVITGCSHPGILKITERVQEGFPGEKIKMAFGGFHLIDKSETEVQLIAKELKNRGVLKVGPTHCTGNQAQEVFKRIYDDKFISIAAGMTFEV
ncbi:MAG: MBL fold metallo-hydrolase [Candidatus Omnitrophica bacterium]|nr:MBL fold metallo-hydrolase [Candidatus Omnitrophota bacterium]MDD5429871.1 MBL fold metallo-hydrolase [Candidatus Omnitrophota bacterium]